MLKTWSVGTGAMALALLVANVAAAGEKIGLITSVHLAQQHVDKVFVKIAGAYSSSQPEPACSSGADGWDFVLDISQSTGKAIYSQLIAAQYARAPVQVMGAGSCAHPNYETLSYIVIEN